MAKAKKTDAADAARRRRVEALRDDCRRHQDGCVRIAFNEGGSVRLTGDEGRWVRRLLKNHRAPEDHRTIEMALKSAGLDASQRALALLARMGTLIAATKDEANEFEDPTDHAMYTLAMRAPGRTSFFNPSEPLFFPAIPESTARTKEEHIKQAKAAALHARFVALSGTWQDQEHEKFAEEFVVTMKGLKKFVELSEKHTPFLLRKAQRIEEYLGQR